MKKTCLSIVISFFLSCVLCAGGIAPVFADQQQATILLLEPILHSADDMTFMKRGIVDMLSSRLAGTGNVKVMTLGNFPEETGAADNPEQAIELGRRLGVDYVVLQSITVIGSSLSTDAKVLDIAKGNLALSFSRAGNQQADVITHVSQLASQINSSLFGVKTATANASQSRPDQNQQPIDPVHQHPEKLLGQINQGGLYAQEGYEGGQARVAAGQFFARSRRIGTQLRGVAAGDVTGDGKINLVGIDANTVYIYDIVDAQIAKVAQVDGGANCLGVDVADVNGNGRAEIFVTNNDPGKMALQSFVLEYDGSQYKRRAGSLRNFYRKIDWPGRGNLLACQRGGLDELYSPGIYEVGNSGDTYDCAEKLPVPRQLSLFGTTVGSVRSRDGKDIVVYNSSGVVEILDGSGNEEWASSEEYGGSVTTIERKSKIDPREKETIYLPLRLRLHDLNGDGRQEIFVIRNDISSGRTFKNVRIFKNGRMEILAWDQLGMRSIWHTRNLSKLISDFDLADLDGDGTPEVITAVVQETGSGLSSGSSYLAIFKIGDLSAVWSEK